MLQRLHDARFQNGLISRILCVCAGGFSHRTTLNDLWNAL